MTVHAHIKNLQAMVVKTLACRNMRLAILAKQLIIITSYSLLLTCLCSCSTIDDDLSDCGFEVNYELKLTTNIQTKVQTQIQTDLELLTNVDLTTSLTTYLGNIFHDYADDVDLSFYDVNGDSVRLEHDQHEMNGKEESYTLNIPRRHYQHLATANVLQEQGVEARNTELCHTARLVQLPLDTIPSHTTGLFSARYDMDIKDSINQTFNVHLYMANSATVLVIDTLGSHIRDMKVYATGFANGFQIADSTYIFDGASPIVRANPIDVADKQYACFSTVNFPSRDKLIIPVGAPQRAATDGLAPGLWDYHRSCPRSLGLPPLHQDRQRHCDAQCDTIIQATACRTGAGGACQT